MTDKALKNGQDPASQTGPVFAMHNIYIKDLSFEAPGAPAVFNKPWKPKVDFDLQMGSQILSEKDHIFDVVLHVTVTVKLPEMVEDATVKPFTVFNVTLFALAIATVDKSLFAFVKLISSLDPAANVNT